VVKGLAKAKARVEQDALWGHTESLEQLLLLLKKAVHLFHHTLICRISLHLLRLPLHMHYADAKAPCAGVAKQRLHLGGLEATDIVDEIDADVQGCIDHAGSTAVEREWKANVLQGLENGADPLEFLGGIDRRSARPRALSTNIQNIGPIGLHAMGCIERLRQVEMPPAIGEGVWGDVENAHDQGPIETQPMPPTMKKACRGAGLGYRLH